VFYVSTYSPVILTQVSAYAVGAANQRTSVFGTPTTSSSTYVLPEYSGVCVTDHRTRTTFAVGVDPGPSTGLSIIRGDGVRVHIQQGSPSAVLDDFSIRFPFLCAPGADVLVGCERFVVTEQTARNSSQPVPLQVIGIVEQLARLHDWTFKLQSPSDAKHFVHNDVLRNAGLWVTGRDVEQHDANDANDATRHALMVLATHRATMFDQILLRTGA
jgi:hypothetical protein